MDEIRPSSALKGTALPEGPEAAIVADVVRQRLSGYVFRDWTAIFDGAAVLRRLDVAAARETVGKTVYNVRSYGKAVLIGVDQTPLTWVLRLGMSGSCRVLTASAIGRSAPDFSVVPITPHARTAHVFDGESSVGVLVFDDPRKFGTWTVAEIGDGRVPGIGVDWRSPAWMLVEAWRHAFKRRPKTPVKAAMMDQTWVGGVGNIYACEALYSSGIRPDTPAGEVSFDAIGRLVAAAKEAMDLGYKSGGLSVKNFASPDGSLGTAQDHLRVYGRAGQPCQRCGRAIVRAVVAGRGTYWCRSCQP